MGGCGGVVKCGIVKRACTKERENIVPDYCRFPLLRNLSEKGRFPLRSLSPCRDRSTMEKYIVTSLTWLWGVGCEKEHDIRGGEGAVVC